MQLLLYCVPAPLNAALGFILRPQNENGVPFSSMIFLFIWWELFMVTVEVINRVFFIKVEQYGTGTVVDHNGKQYLVTAKHLLEGKEEVSSIKFYHDEQWKDLNVQLVGIGRGELDIAVFSSDLLLCRKDLPLPNGTKGIGLSQDVYMLGFPYKMHTKAGETLGGRPCPFVKKRYLSVIVR